MNDFVTSPLVENYQQHSHEGYDTQQNHGVSQGIPNLCHRIWALFMEWSVGTVILQRAQIKALCLQMQMKYNNDKDMSFLNMSMSL